MKKLLFTILMFGFFGVSMAQSNNNGPTQIEISATGIAEMYKKELNLDKEQYAKVKQSYIKFMTYQAYNPDIPGIGTDKLEKNMQKILTEEQFKKWREIDPNRPPVDDGKSKKKKK